MRPFAVQAEGRILFARGRGKSESPEFEIGVVKAEGDAGRAEVQLEVRVVIVKQKFRSDAGVGFVFKMVVKRFGKTRFDRIDRRPVKGVHGLAVKDAARNVQIRAIGMRADKAAWDAVFGVELVEGRADIPPARGV